MKNLYSGDVIIEFISFCIENFKLGHFPSQRGQVLVRKRIEFKSKQIGNSQNIISRYE